MKTCFAAAFALLMTIIGASAEGREWSDASGKFKIEADFVAVRIDKVILEKTDGSVISVPLEKLSEADRQYIKSLTEKHDSAEKKDQAGSAASSTGVPESSTNTTIDAADGLALARQVRGIFEANCYRCHGQDGATEGGFNFIMNLEKLTKTHVKPNNLAGSMLYSRISSSDADSAMPPAGEKPRPSAEDIAVVQKWIQVGAPIIDNEKPRDFISNEQMFKFILADLRATTERARKYNRYFTFTHLYNAGMSEDELQTYRHAFVKLLNSLSWNSDLVLPDAVDPGSTIYRVDIRQLNWNDQIWTEIVNRNPYGLKFTGPDATACYKESSSEMPAVRADWFVFAAARPPLYHTILALPETASELEQMLHVNAAADISQEQVSRAAFNRSGVSRNNRLIERHRLPYGSYWKSYDFGSNTGQKNLFEHPMGPGDNSELFRQDGGEIIFSLPNGLQGYMLVNGEGRRIDKGPTEIVSDPKSADRAVLNGLSCMSCHYAGMISKSDEIRPFVEANKKAFSDRDSILALYPQQKTLDNYFETDGKRFAGALEKIGIKAVTRTGEPVSTMSQRFEQELDMKLAAAEFGFTPDELDKWLDKSETMARALGALRVPGGTVKRDSFVEVFGQAALQFGLVASTVTPIVNDVPTTSIPRTTSKAATLKSASPRTARSSKPIDEPKQGEFKNYGDMGWGVESVAFSPDGKKLAVGKMDRAVLLFDVDSGTQLCSLNNLNSLDQVTSVAFTPDGKKLLGGGSKGEIVVWDVGSDGNLTPTGKFAGHNDAVRSIIISRDSRFALSGGADKAARYWQTDNCREISTVNVFQTPVAACALLADGHHAVASDGTTLVKFDLTTGKAQETIQLGENSFKLAPYCLAISPTGDRIASNDVNGMHVWNAQIGKELPKLASKGIQWGAAFSPDGKLLFTSGDGNVNVWEVSTQKRIGSLEFSSYASLKSIAVSPNGKLIAAGASSAGQQLKVFQVPKP